MTTNSGFPDLRFVKKPNPRNLGKYLLHGIAFAALLFLLTLFSTAILGILSVVGAFVGLIIGLVILLILAGVINTFITTTLWFKIETSWAKYLYHGILLLIILGIVGLPLQFLYSQSSSLTVAPRVLSGVILFLGSSFIYGYIGKRVASIWVLPEPKPPSTYGEPLTRRASAPPRSQAAKPAETSVTPIAPGSPEELKREEAKLDRLEKHRQKTGLLNPEILDNLIETQKKTVETLRKAPNGKNP